MYERTVCPMRSNSSITLLYIAASFPTWLGEKRVPRLMPMMFIFSFFLFGVKESGVKEGRNREFRSEGVQEFRQ